MKSGAREQEKSIELLQCIVDGKKPIPGKGIFSSFILFALFLAGEAVWIQSLAVMALGSRIKFSCHRTCWSVHAPSSYVSFQALNTCKQKKQPAAKMEKSRCDVKIHGALCHHCKMCLLDLSTCVIDIFKFAVGVNVNLHV